MVLLLFLRPLVQMWQHHSTGARLLGGWGKIQRISELGKWPIFADFEHDFLTRWRLETPNGWVGMFN